MYNSLKWCNYWDFNTDNMEPFKTKVFITILVGFVQCTLPHYTNYKLINSIVIELSIFLAGFSQGIFMTLAVAIIQELTAEKIGDELTVFTFFLPQVLCLYSICYMDQQHPFFSARLIIGAMGGLFLLVVMLFWLTTPSLYKIRNRSSYKKKSSEVSFILSSFTLLLIYLTVT